MARESYIPVAKSELIAALAKGADLPDDDRARFVEVARMLAAVIHYEAFDGLERLKDLYAPLDPDAPSDITRAAPQQAATRRP